MNDPNLPNFIVIGVQKAGTTSIYNYLQQHPQVFMSPVKETNFFERDWDQAPASARAKKRNGIDTFEKYCQLFDGVTNELAIGEASPNYLFHHQESVALIHRHLPQVKLVAILRNPVERAYSDYLMHIRDAIADESNSLAYQVEHHPRSSFTLLKGLYYEQLQHFYEVFDPQQIQIHLYDELRQDAIAMMQRLYDFLGVDPQFKPDTSQKAQVARVPKNQTLNKLVQTKNPVRSAVAGALRTVLPTSARQQLRSRILTLNSASKQNAPLSDRDRAQLLDYYREDIMKLQSLIQRDLSAWLR
jgi:hypothetical protein